MLKVSCKKSISVSERSNLLLSLNTYGYVVVNNCYTRDSLLSLAETFGEIQLHNRADSDGIVGSNGSSISQEWKQNEKEYIGTLKGKLLPHTDGAYLNGLSWREGALRRVLPPSIVILQCVEQANIGGENTLIDMQPIAQELRLENPKAFQVLSQRGSASFCRDGDIAVDMSIFEEISPNHLQVRYNSNRFMYSPQWARDSVTYLHNKYINQEKYKQSIRLQDGEVLVIDNTRMLHGRNSFSLKHTQITRAMRRLWVAQYNSDALTNSQGLEATHKVLNKFSSYLPLTRSISNQSPLLSYSSLGIKLS